MRRPSSLIVLLLMCTAVLKTCVAVRFLTLEEMLRYHEQLQNPDSEEMLTEEMEAEETFLSTTTTVIPRQPSTALPQDHRGHHHFDLEENGSGSEFDETTTLAMTPSTTTMMQTEQPTTTRRMTTCCRLGEEAGLKRHHCNPDNYLPRLLRNQNRGHNFKHTNKQPSQRRTQFDKCVSGIVRRLSDEFRTCCEEAYKRMWQSETGEEIHHGDRTHLLEIPIEI